MVNYSILLCFLIGVSAGPATESYKNEFCTDPRTMQKHGAYTEWADAYSCTRHRCQPGGRNLAIYTVGCKHVEAPESAIECEEVVEDTNMQFPFCCTRLRCLVVVRGEVWTRVLGQPWETLPAAPWSHMYKMKRPPPSDHSLLPFNTAENGPVYALSEPTNEDSRDVLLRSVDRSATTARSSHSNHGNHGNHQSPPLRSDRADSSPDIVIALTTDNKKKERLNPEPVRQEIRPHKSLEPGLLFDDDLLERRAAEPDAEDTLIPEKEGSEHHPDVPPPDSRESKGGKDRNLQALVDAIGSRMRDIEHVVKKMSEKVHITKPEEPQYNIEKQESELELPWRRTIDKEGGEAGDDTLKKPGLGDERHSRFSLRSKDAKSSHKAVTTELPYTEDVNGYFNDASNSVFKREGPSEPALTYMAPVDNSQKSSALGDVDKEADKMGKKHNKKLIHRKKKAKGHRKRKIKEGGNRRKGLSSGEGRNLLSIEDSGSVVNK